MYINHHVAMHKSFCFFCFFYSGIWAIIPALYILSHRVHGVHVPVVVLILWYLAKANDLLSQNNNLGNDKYGHKINAKIKQ